MRPLVFNWDGEAMVPLPRFARTADREFVIGELYRLAPVEERSVASHNQFFAAVHDRWLSLPDAIAVQFPTEDILRKHALIMTGFRRERKFVASSKEEARKLAAFMRPQSIDDDYTIISVHENVVIEWKALSQSLKGMPTKGQFQASKKATLEWLDALLGVEAEAA